MSDDSVWRQRAIARNPSGRRRAVLAALVVLLSVASLASAPGMFGHGIAAPRALWQAANLQAPLPSPSLVGASNGGVEDPLPVTVSYIPTGSPRSINIAGSFNGWDKAATRLAPIPGSLTWAVTLRLAPGVYEYRLVVNGSRWLTPQDAPRRNDGSGSINALLLVAPPEFARLPARLGDGHITASGVIHRVSSSAPASTARGVRYVTRPDRGHIELTLRTRHEDVHDCWLVTDGPAPAAGGSSDGGRISMVRYAADALFDYWRADAPVRPGTRSLRYAFVLRDGSAERRYDAADILSSPSGEIRWFQVTLADFPPFETPEWARDAIFYQIFPDRFANGEKANDPADVEPWGSPPTFSSRMGGDIAGITQHLEYLRDLGINGLYLNPIFDSRSSHGYDTTDYMKVDPRFGTTAELKSLTARAHLHGWHVILDGVFNHTGVDFAPFQSVLREGRSSPYRNWYFVHGFPISVNDGPGKYVGWNGSPWMPKLNVGNPQTRDYLLDVATHWIHEAQIDGWRLDAANEVSHDFWKTFRRSVKTAKPDAYLVGEIWADARDWLQGDEMDSVMSYRWRSAALDFFAFDKTTPAQFDAALTRIRTDYPPSATAVSFNMLGSHDVERLRTLCKDDWTKERQAVAFQMTYPGTPCIYYGDEVGLEGGRDPDNRRAMPWDSARWDRATHAFYKSAIALRQQHAVLRRGDFHTVAVDDKAGVYAFLRAYNAERALVVFNRSDLPQKIAIPAAKIGTSPFRSWLDTGATAQRVGANLVISLPPRGFAVQGR